ncbi:MAG: hypothetical protein HY554_12865 [Elusimicrobia bacterium]|nr:hypothetical protein [Elusimicrobiota bacterium]
MLARLAWRIYRRHWRQLLFFSACIAAGVAFLVGLEHLLTAVRGSVALRARELLAADAEVSSYRPFDARAEALFERLKASGHRVAEVVTFSSMLAAGEGEPFLVGVKAAGAGYPFYGRVVSRPANAAATGRDGLLDESAAEQRGLRPGARLRLGGAELRLGGLLVKEPDRTLSGFNLAPRLLIGLEAVGRTGLVRFGSRIRHARLVALPAAAGGPEAAARLKAAIESELSDPYLNVTAYTDADVAVRDALERVGGFFILLALVALLLAAVGMASTMTMFLNEQLETAATLRCLGLRERDVGAIYGLLCLAIGLQGGALGAAAGWGLSAAGVGAASRLLGLAIPVTARLDPRAAAEGLALACALAVALNWAKVRALARTPPLEAARRRADGVATGAASKAALIAAGGAGLFLYAFAKSNSWRTAGWFAAALGGSCALTALLILGAVQGLAAAPLARLGFALRHGLLALTRHRARTLVFLFTLSLGLALLGALGLVHRSLSSEILLGRSDQAPDLFLVDVQKSQLEGVRRVLAAHARAPEHAAPLIRARLTHVDGAPVLRRDRGPMTVEERARQRFLTREYNLTYKDALQDSERIVAGSFWRPGEAGPQISLEEGFCRRLGIGLGARLTFDVQGRPVEGVVTSLRRVNWISMHPNFFVVFPTRALEPAPQTFIASLRVRDAAKASSLRRALSRAYPNVSVIDLSRVLDNVQSTLAALIGALDALAWFCVGVGLLVLAGAVGLGRKERLERAALYRALGCTRWDLIRIDAAEFLVLGAVAFLIAAVTSHALDYAVALKMEISFAPSFSTLAAMLAAALACPTAVGLAVYRPAYRSAALETLRREA